MVEWDLAFEMRNEIPYWLQILTISSEILWDALTESLSTSTPKTRTLCLLLFGIFEKLTYREREISVSSTETILIIGKMEGRGGCAAVKLAGLPLKSICSKHFHAHTALKLKCLQSVSHVCLILETWRPSALPRDSEPGCSLQSADGCLYQGR